MFQSSTYVRKPVTAKRCQESYVVEWQLNGDRPEESDGATADAQRSRKVHWPQRWTHQGARL